jgi:DNA-directed RNA polymerase beta' subunit
VADNLTCDDDLTIQYVEIVKINNHLADLTLTDTKKQKYIQSLKFRIKCLYDNSQEKAKHTNGRPMKGIKKRIAGKEGQIRNNLMGKRVNKSARTVIGPDPTLCVDEIAVPPEIANILTYPVKVNNYNFEKINNLVNRGDANFVIRDNGNIRINLDYALFRTGKELMYGDKIIKADGTEIVVTNLNMKVCKDDKIFRNDVEVTENANLCKKKFQLQIGDTVERKLQDGDIVLLNRQPTLHKGSMLAQRIKIIPGKTIRMNLAITKTFNADFDGDEMNIHAPSNPETEAELRLLSCSKYNMISSQSSKPGIAIVQDSLLGAYLMTCGYKEIPKHNFFTIANRHNELSIDDIFHKIKLAEEVYAEKEVAHSIYNGKTLLSLCLPDDFIYSQKNGADPTEPVIKIYKGIIYQGAINKKNIGSGHMAITNLLHKEYNEEVAIQFVNNVQFLANEWLLYHGFSIGIKDCIATETQKINAVVNRCFIEAKGVEETTRNPRIREVKVNAALSKARDNGMKLAKDALAEDNNFLSTVTSGSKGDYFNIAQITGLLGQQNFSGGRIKETLNNCTRTLPHYPFKMENKEQEYESKGFIKNSFIHGLNPREFWFHAVTGREGLTDTAMKTAQSGYIQRRMIKLGEDIQVKYDQTVRNAKGDIIQFAYGDDSFDATQTSIIKGKPSICDVKRLSEQLNLQHEMK